MLDTTQIYDIMSIEKGVADRRLAPYDYKEVTELVGELWAVTSFLS